MNTNKNLTSPNSKLIEPALSYQIVGVLFDIHNELGSTLLEKHYQRAVAVGLGSASLRFSEQVPINLNYKGKWVGKYLLDFLIENKVVLEIKAKPTEPDNFFKQVLSYLRESNLPLGIIANFRSGKLEYKRVINPTFIRTDSIDIGVY